MPRHKRKEFMKESEGGMGRRLKTHGKQSTLESLLLSVHNCFNTLAWKNSLVEACWVLFTTKKDFNMWATMKCNSFIFPYLHFLDKLERCCFTAVMKETLVISNSNNHSNYVLYQDVTPWWWEDRSPCFKEQEKCVCRITGALPQLFLFILLANM